MSNPAYGRVQVAEPPSNLKSLHIHDGVTPLKVVSHVPPIEVLDQSDLIEQGIFTDKLIPGAARVDSLGSCTANTFIEAASRHLTLEAFIDLIEKLTGIRQTPVNVYTDTVVLEKAAIVFYHMCTDQTGDSGSEWPPTDCGSSGPFIVELAIKLGVCTGQHICAASQLVSLLQNGVAMMGSPWFYSWEQTDTGGYIDGDGSPAALRTAIASGVAGGHETLLFGVTDLSFDLHGNINPLETVLEGRNHWKVNGAPWGVGGNYKVHLSTLMALGSHCDFRQLVG